VALARKLLVALWKYVTAGVVNGYMVIVLFDATATARDGVALYQHVRVVLSDEGREGREPIACFDTRISTNSGPACCRITKPTHRLRFVLGRLWPEALEGLPPRSPRPPNSN
jgi:hypothetical protein